MAPLRLFVGLLFLVAVAQTTELLAEQPTGKPLPSVEATQPLAELKQKLGGALLRNGGFSRQLLATRCSIQFDNKVLPYTACQSLQPGVLNFLYNFTEAGEGRYVLSGALDSTATGWVGLGFPQYPGSMKGASAIVMQPCDTCPQGARVNTYFLGGYEANKVVSPGWSINITRMGAVKSIDGRISCTFSMMVPYPFVSADLTRVNFIHATGPVNANNIQMHQRSNAFAHVIDLTLGRSYIKAKPKPAAPAPPGEPPSAPAPAAENVTEILGPTVDAQELETAVDAGTVEVVAAPAPAAAEGAAPEPALAALGPAPEEAPALDKLTPGVDQCGKKPSGAGSKKAYTHCISAANTVGTDYSLFWNIYPPANIGGSQVMEGALVVKTDGWAGFGFPLYSGEMVGSDAIVVSNCSSCKSGAKIDFYFLGGKSPEKVLATRRLTVMGTPAAAKKDGLLTASFTIELPRTVRDTSFASYIYAVGPLNADGLLAQHDLKKSGYGAVDLGNPTRGYVIAEGRGWVHVHGWLMGLCWGVVIPFGAVVARNFKDLQGPFKGVWFQVHRTMQTVAFVGGLLGVGFGLAMGTVKGTSSETGHKVLGFTVVALGFGQVSALAFRPPPESRKRAIWTVLHQNAGRLAVLMAITNVFLGLSVANEKGIWYGIYAGALALVTFAMVGKEGWDTLQKGARHHAKHGGDNGGERSKGKSVGLQRLYTQPSGLSLLGPQEDKSAIMVGGGKANGRYVPLSERERSLSGALSSGSLNRTLSSNSLENSRRDGTTIGSDMKVNDSELALFAVSYAEERRAKEARSLLNVLDEEADKAKSRRGRRSTSPFAAEGSDEESSAGREKELMLARSRSRSDMDDEQRFEEFRTM